MMNNYNPNFAQQQPYYGQPYGQPYGTAYGVSVPKAMRKQPLTQEEINHLRNNGGGFSMKVDPDDLLRAKCTHRDRDGNDTLIPQPDGSMLCTICGEKLWLKDYTQEDVNRCIDEVKNLFQVTKTIYLNMPENLASQYFQMLPLLEMFKKLWPLAVNDFAKYNPDNNNPTPIYGDYYGGNAFAQIGSMLTNPYMYQQNVMAPGMVPGMPVAQGAPVTQQQMPYMAPQGNMYYGNPMAYGTPAMPGAVPQAPQAPMPGAVPQAAPAPATPTAAPAAQPAEVQQQQVFTV